MLASVGALAAALLALGFSDGAAEVQYSCDFGVCVQNCQPSDCSVYGCEGYCGPSCTNGRYIYCGSP